MSITEDFLREVDPIVRGTAASMGARYRSYGADHEDMYQVGVVWCFDHPQRVSEYMENTDYGSRQLATALRNEMQDYGENLKAQRLGYSRDDLFFYSKGMVRELLPKMFDDEAWLHAETPGLDSERRAPAAPAEGGNWIATLADVSRAYAGLDVEDRDLLAAFHRDEWSNKLMAESFGISEQTMSYRHDRALRRLVDALGGPRPRVEHDSECAHGWGVGRRVVSNAEARWVQQSYYDE